jgi:hypothetical protein
MNDGTLLILIAIGSSLFIFLLYLFLRVIEKKYHSRIDVCRRIFATYSFPLLVILIIILLAYDPLTGNVCSLVDTNSNSWACKSLSYLILPLIVSMTYSWHYWAVYRKGWDPIDQATGQGFKPKKRWTFYSIFTLAVFVLLLLAALL